MPRTGTQTGAARDPTRSARSRETALVLYNSGSEITSPAVRGPDSGRAAEVASRCRPYSTETPSALIGVAHFLISLGTTGRGALTLAISREVPGLRSSARN